MIDTYSIVLVCSMSVCMRLMEKVHEIRGFLYEEPGACNEHPRPLNVPRKFDEGHFFAAKLADLA